MTKDKLGDRMKCYENVNRHYLIRRMPVIIRLDMRAGHTFTRGFRKPFDEAFMSAMHDTMKYLCENIPGCVLGYTQSDEISLALIDYQTLETGAWFDNNVQKLASVSASMATLEFNRSFANCVRMLPCANTDTLEKETENKRVQALKKSAVLGATFDSRVFNLPKEEVTNYFLWRQNDASRNSISAVGQANFTQKQLLGKSGNNIRDMLITQRGIDWGKLPTVEKLGCTCIRKQKEDSIRAHWVLDMEMPVLKGEERDYVERLIYI